MANIYSYLTFNGNCRHAMDFYQQCLGGKLSFQTIGEAPLVEQMPDEIRNYIVQATLSNDNLVLVATDMVADEGLSHGNAISLLLNCSSEKELRNYYTKLSVGGHATQEIEVNFWGLLFGSLIDKYGNHWLLSCSLESAV